MTRLKGWNRTGFLAALLLLVACVGQPQTAGQPAATVPSTAASKVPNPTARPEALQATDAPEAAAEADPQPTAELWPILRRDRG